MNAGAAVNNPSQDSSDKVLERISNMAQSGSSSDNLLEKVCPIKLAQEPSCENNKVIFYVCVFLG